MHVKIGHCVVLRQGGEDAPFIWTKDDFALYAVLVGYLGLVEHVGQHVPVKGIHLLVYPLGHDVAVPCASLHIAHGIVLLDTIKTLREHASNRRHHMLNGLQGKVVSLYGRYLDTVVKAVEECIDHRCAVLRGIKHAYALFHVSNELLQAVYHVATKEDGQLAHVHIRAHCAAVCDGIVAHIVDNVVLVLKVGALENKRKRLVIAIGKKDAIYG